MLLPGETALVGQWLSQGASVAGDATCRRIESLIGEYLVSVARSLDGWCVLYRDPADGRLWEHTYPQGHLHGGGPPALHCISTSDAMAKYGYAA